MKPTFFENLFGSWPGALLLGGFGVVACLAGIATFQQGPLYALVMMYGGILAVKHAVRLRARVAHMREFGRQWARVAGWEEPPTRGVKGWLWWLAKSSVKVALGAGLGLLAYGLWGIDSSNDDPQQRNIVLVLFWGTLTAFLAVMFRRHLYAFWLARQERKRRYEEGSEVDGKHLPRHFVEQALSVPMRSPGAAWFTQELPEYCQPLLHRRSEAAADAADDDSIEDAAAPAPAAEQKPGFSFSTKALAEVAVLAAIGGLAAILQPYLSPFLDKLKGREAAPVVAEASQQRAGIPPVPDRTAFVQWMKGLGVGEEDALEIWEREKPGTQGGAFFSSFYLSKGRKAEANAWAQLTRPEGHSAPPTVASPDLTILEKAFQKPAQESPAVQRFRQLMQQKQERLAAGVKLPTDQDVKAEKELVEAAKAAGGEGYLPAQLHAAGFHKEIALELDKSEDGKKFAPQWWKDAAFWYRKAAAQGDAGAQAFLGSMYFMGQGGLQEDAEEGLKWLRMAAKQGHKPAEDLLAKLQVAKPATQPVAAVTPVPPSPKPQQVAKPSVQVEPSTSDGRDPCAVGHGHEYGTNGYPKDLAESAKWFRRCAAQGIDDGIYNVATKTYAGFGGFAKDEAEGLRLLQRCSAMGGKYGKACEDYMQYVAKK